MSTSLDVIAALKGKRTMVTVADLTALGCKVKVRHVRPVVPGKPRILKDEDVHVDHQRDRREKALQFRYYYPPVYAAMGGRTEVLIELPNGEILVGSCECSDLDHYNRKYGGKKAIARALAPLLREEKIPF